MRYKSAFTLTEIVIVVAIISIISVYAAVSFSMASSRQLEAQTRKLTGDLCRIRDMAVARHRSFIVDFNTTSRVYAVYQDSISPANFMEQKALEVNSISITPAPANVQFDFPRGTTTQDKQIDLTYKGLTRQITVSSETGYVKWQ